MSPKIFQLICFFIPLLLFACSSITKLSPSSVNQDERLILLRLFHLDGVVDNSEATTFYYRLDGKKASLTETPFAAKREVDHLRYVVIPKSTKRFGLDDVVFGSRGFAYQANYYGDKPLSEVDLPQGNDPVYVGSFFIRSHKKDWGDKVFNTISQAQEVESIEVKDEMEEVHRIIKSKGFPQTPVKAILPNPFIKKKK